VSGSTKWPFSRTQFTRWRTSARSARDPWMINAMCLEFMASDSAYHAPVLANEVNELLAKCTTVLDGTLGGGGHSLALLSAGVERIVGVDRDPEALAAAHETLREFRVSGRFAAYESNYADIGEVPEIGMMRFDGILLDLGISSHQVDASERGFTFRLGAPLDMRMGRDVSRDAAAFLNSEEEASLGAVFREYGDEPRGARLAREVVRRRERRPFATSDDFVGAIRAVLGPRSGPSDFARLFQALRIAVNDEIAGLARALPTLRDRLTRGGTMVVISYHSGEDRVVKHTFRDWSAACICPPKQPICTCRGRPLGTTLTRRAFAESADDVHDNPRARSARLRAWQSVR
jgi:16S rRNA (cytosine1402-N4)-methyltransferase